MAAGGGGGGAVNRGLCACSDEYGNLIMMGRFFLFKKDFGK